MELRRNPARRAGLVGLAVLLVFGASACSGGTGLVGPAPAATVNGTTISQAQLDDMVAGYRKLFELQVETARAGLKEQIAQGQTQSTEADLEAEIERVRAPYALNGDTYPTEGAASQLTQLITQEIYEQAAATIGEKITEEDRDQAKASLIETDASFSKAPKAVQDTYIGIAAATTALQRAVPKDLQDAVAGASDQYEAQLQQAYEQDKESLNQVCSFEIVADAAAAASAADRVRSGEDPATVAGEASGTGGAAQPTCRQLATITETFGEDASLEKGAILGPVDVGGSSVVLFVDSAGIPSYEEARAQIAQQVPDEFSAKAQADISAWLKDVVGRHADVVVDRRFGTWDRANLQVVPPVVPTAPTATSKSKATTTTSLVVAGS